jgi:hypothetical protein
MKPKAVKSQAVSEPAYGEILGDISALIATAQGALSRSANCIMTATYWLIGRRIVEFEQGGKARAEYGEALLRRLSGDLSQRFGRGFGVDNLQRFRSFYVAYLAAAMHATASRISARRDAAEKYATLSRTFSPTRCWPPSIAPSCRTSRNWRRRLRKRGRLCKI